jgi:hypothetical protein
MAENPESEDFGLSVVQEGAHAGEKLQLSFCILLCVWVIMDGVWTGNWIYGALTDRNYN